MKTPEQFKYEQEIWLKIKKGILPRFMFAKDKDDKLERKKVNGKMKLTWRMVSTFLTLTKEEYESKN